MIQPWFYLKFLNPHQNGPEITVSASETQVITSDQVCSIQHAVVFSNQSSFICHALNDAPMSKYLQTNHYYGPKPLSYTILLEEVLHIKRCRQKHGGSDAISMTTGPKIHASCHWLTAILSFRRCFLPPLVLHKYLYRFSVFWEKYYYFLRTFLVWRGGKTVVFPLLFLQCCICINSHR